MLRDYTFGEDEKRVELETIRATAKDALSKIGAELDSYIAHEEDSGTVKSIESVSKTLMRIDAMQAHIYDDVFPAFERLRQIEKSVLDDSRNTTYTIRLDLGNTERAYIEGGRIHIKTGISIPRNSFLFDRKYVVKMARDIFSDVDLSDWDRFGKYKIVYAIHFEKGTPESFIKDDDNFDTKIFRDEITKYLFADDSSRYVSSDTEIFIGGKKTYTEIIIVPDKSFGKWRDDWKQNEENLLASQEQND